jgi:hypothetical protein
MPSMRPHTQTSTESYTRLSNQCHIEQRVCLWCNWWMRSCSPAHRKCNYCKHDLGGSPVRVGNRIRPVEIHTTESFEWKQDEIESEFANVLHLDNGGEK